MELVASSIVQSVELRYDCRRGARGGGIAAKRVEEEAGLWSVVSGAKEMRFRWPFSRSGYETSRSSLSHCSPLMCVCYSV